MNGGPAGGPTPSRGGSNCPDRLSRQLAYKYGSGQTRPVPELSRRIDTGAPSVPRLTIDARRQGRTSDQVYALLVSAIRELRLLPAAVLSENALAAQLGVSRTPVREALARLADNGLVEVTPQVGTRVVPISMTEVRQAQWVRETLEVQAFELACADEPDLRGLRSSLRAQTSARQEKDLDDFFRADEQLHAELFRLSGHPRAWDLIVRSKIHLDRLRRLSVPSSSAVGTLIAEHRRIVAALSARDVVAGTTLIRGHARRVLQLQPALQKAYPDYFQEE